MKARTKLLLLAVLVLGLTGAVAAEAIPENQQQTNEVAPTVQADSQTTAEPIPATDQQPLADPTSTQAEAAPTSTTTSPTDSTTTPPAAVPEVQQHTKAQAMPSDPVYIGNNTYVAPGTPSATFTFDQN